MADTFNGPSIVTNVTDLESNDKYMINCVINSPPSVVQYNLDKWTSDGYPPNYNLLAVTLICPSVCSDGKTRDVPTYIQYLTGNDITNLPNSFQETFPNYHFSYTVLGNTFILQVSKV